MTCHSTSSATRSRNSSALPSPNGLKMDSTSSFVITPPELMILPRHSDPRHAGHTMKIGGNPMKRQLSLTSLAILALGTVCAAQQCPSGQYRNAAGNCIRSGQASSRIDVTKDWPSDNQRAAKAFSDKYGQPDE